MTVREKIDRLSGPGNDLHGKDFLLSWNVSDAGILAVQRIAAVLQDLHAAGTSCRVFDTGLGLSIFRDHSTRTRYSFRSGCNLLGLMTEELDESTSQIAHGETVRETATMISFLTEAVGIRDDMFLGEGHRYMAEFAGALEESHAEGVLPQRPSVINLQCDLDHPTQSMADLRHLTERFGGPENLRGKKLAMTWAYSPSYGKPLSVPQAVIALMTRFGMDVTLAHPDGYELVEEPLAAAARNAGESGGSFRTVSSMDEAFDGADVVYPKSWAPMRVMKERTRLLRAGDTAKLAALEKDALAENARHQDWECTEEKMARTAGGRALYMHCLPADITGVSCEAGEVAASVFEKARLDTYHEAGHKPFVVAAMLLATRFADPGAVLRRLAEGDSRRRLDTNG
ncbi:MAG TPA: knotted carbamoyltransferase YgeW [bacterium]|nr:knotted carbamoyltransferase YgeW [bacterium]